MEFVVAIIAAGAAVGAAVWAKVSAEAANRSAAAAERSAAAEERAADAAHAQLRLEQERIERERRALEEDRAPAVWPTGDYGEDDFSLKGDQIVGLLRNFGKTAAVVEEATLEYPGGTAQGEIERTPLPRRVGADVAGALTFRLPVEKLETLTQGAEPLAVSLTFAAEEGAYRGRTSFKLSRNGADAAGNLRWRTHKVSTDRLD